MTGSFRSRHWIAFMVPHQVTVDVCGLLINSYKLDQVHTHVPCIIVYYIAVTFQSTCAYVCVCEDKVELHCHKSLTTVL